ncbi:hypothetical protein JW887_01315 [Candidatus Dojkabacteria bacterium]|nr:hypothetical protein [Candidatus Dojkabacteria bacterium]
MLDRQSSIKTLLSRGVCGHGHLEGTVITDKISKLVYKAFRYFKQNKSAEKQFQLLTGWRVDDVLANYQRLMDQRESGIVKQQNFEKDFLPYLYVMKLCESSNPDIIYEVTCAQLEYDLEHYLGFTREVNPTIWLEMGLDYDICCEAFISAVVHELQDIEGHSPIEIGAAVKRKFLTKHFLSSNSSNPFMEKSDKPYLKVIEFLEKLKQRNVCEFASLFVDVQDVGHNEPLFNTKKCPDREECVRDFFSRAKASTDCCHVHLLEEVIDRELLIDDLDQISELNEIVDLFGDLHIKNARFIHMAYWPNKLPFLEEMSERGYEIAFCPTSTKILGASHNPPSPFLMENKDVMFEFLFDEGFPRIVMSTDDCGVFGTSNVWDEYELIYDEMSAWYGIEFASVAIILLFRDSMDIWSNMGLQNGFGDSENSDNLENSYSYSGNSYSYSGNNSWDSNGLQSDNFMISIANKYNLEKSALEWFLGWDLFKLKGEIRQKSVWDSVVERGKEIMEEHIACSYSMDDFVDRT